MRITTDGVITDEFPIPTDLCFPNGIARGPDGNLWFTEARAHKIGRITTQGAITEFPTESGPIGIATGPDGNLWFAASDFIGRITTQGAITELALPGAGAHGIAAGPGRKMWFTESSGNRIGAVRVGRGL